MTKYGVKWNGEWLDSLYDSLEDARDYIEKRTVTGIGLLHKSDYSIVEVEDIWVERAVYKYKEGWFKEEK